MKSASRAKIETTIPFDVVYVALRFISPLLPSACLPRYASTSVNNVEFESARNEPQLNPRGETVTPLKRGKGVTFLLPFNNATRLAANYASSSPARLALMTYRRRDSFVTSATRCDATRAVITRRHIQSATLGVTFSSFGTRDRWRARLGTNTFRYRAKQKRN